MNNVRLLSGMATLMSASLFMAACSKASDSTSEAPSAPALFSQPLQQAAQDASAVIAVVNGTEITVGEFNKEMDTMISRMQGRVPPERIGQMRMQMREQLLENLITRQILLDQVNAEGIEVTDEDFNAAVGELSENLPPGVSLSDMLAQTGTSEEEFRETFGMELKVRKLIEAHTGGKLEASEEEIAAFYEENKEQFEQPETVQARHILISIDPADSDEAKAAKRQELEDIREQLVAGAEFADLAEGHSTCPSKAQGGDLGRFPRGRMVPEFEEAAFTQEVGAVGEIVETQFGYHIILVVDRDEAGVTPFDEIKERLGQYLTNQKQQEAAQTYVQELRAKADVTIPGQP